MKTSETGSLRLPERSQTKRHASLRDRLWPSRSKILFPITAIICYLVVRWRADARFQDIYIWAEDGAVYLTRALNLGWKCLATHHAGYFQGLTQAIVWILAFFPLKYLPQAIFHVSIAIFATCVAWFAHPTYRWLVRPDYLRLMTCITLCFAPGMLETVGNVANLQWPLLLLGGLIACKDPAQNFGGADLMAVFLIGSCAGPACTLILPFAVRAMWRRPPHVIDIACVLILMGWSAANFTLRGAHTLKSVDWQAMGNFAGITFALRYLLEPLLGTEMVNLLALQKPLLVRVALVVGLFFSMRLWQFSRQRNPVFAAWVLSSLAVYLMAYIARPRIVVFLERLNGIDRYQVPAGQCALLAWVVCISGAYRAKMECWKVLAALVFLALYIDSAWYRLRIDPYPGSAQSWDTSADALKKGQREGSTVTVQARPDGWPIHYRGTTRRGE